MSRCDCGGRFVTTAPSMYCPDCGFGKAAEAVDRHYRKLIEAADKEHERLSDAVVRFLHEYAPSEYGDLPEIMDRLAQELKDGTR